MSILHDKFNIIENPFGDLTKEDINPIIDNYLENLLFSDEKIIHPDFFNSLSYFEKNKDIEYIKIFTNHLDRYLKQKRLSMRNNIKKGNFELETLLKLIENYKEKIIKVYQICDSLAIRKIASSLLYEEIILENSLTGFLKSELGTIDDSKKKSITSLINKIYEINYENEETKVFQWFLFLISSALSATVEENFNKTYPVPEDYQNIINFSINADFCIKIFNFYSINPTFKYLEIIMSASTKILIEKLVDIFNNCNLNQINKLMKTNFEIFDIIIYKLDNKTIKDLITSKFFFIIGQKISDFKELNLNSLKEFTECIQVFDKIINSTGTTRDVIDMKISNIFSKESTQDYLIETVHQNIINKESNFDNETLANIIGFCNNIKEKDKFIDKYNRLLILRMVNKPNIEIEKIYLNILVNKFGEKILFKTKKIINDMFNSIEDNENFKELIFNNKLNVISTSYNNWDINQQEGLISSDMIKSNSEFTNYLYNYQKFYDKRYSNKRKLNWYPHFGEITFEYLGKDIKMLPVQFLILEHVFNKKEITKQELIDYDLLFNYNLQFKQSLISSLLGGILIIDNDKIKVNDTDKDFISDNYIDIFFNTSNYKEIWENRRKEEFIMNRIDVIKSLINHHVKKSPLNKDDLFEKVKTNNVFEVTIELFEQSIKSMITNDYIKYNESTMIEKLFY